MLPRLAAEYHEHILETLRALDVENPSIASKSNPQEQVCEALPHSPFSDDSAHFAGPELDPALVPHCSSKTKPSRSCAGVVPRLSTPQDPPQFTLPEVESSPGQVEKILEQSGSDCEFRNDSATESECSVPSITFGNVNPSIAFTRKCHGKRSVAVCSPPFPKNCRGVSPWAPRRKHVHFSGDAEDTSTEASKGSLVSPEIRISSQRSSLSIRSTHHCGTREPLQLPIEESLRFVDKPDDSERSRKSSVEARGSYFLANYEQHLDRLHDALEASGAGSEFGEAKLHEASLRYFELLDFLYNIGRKDLKFLQSYDSRCWPFERRRSLQNKCASLGFSMRFEDSMRQLRWERWAHDCPAIALQPEVLREVVFSGMPMKLRRQLWKEWTTMKSKPAGKLRKLQDIASEKAIKEISHDVSCTQPTWLDASHASSLQHVLAAYAGWNPTVGYSPGMNFIAAVFISLGFGENETFDGLRFLVQKVCPGYHTSDRRRFHRDALVLESLVHWFLPSIHNELINAGVSVQSLATDHLISLNSRNWPLDSIVRLWDVILMDGVAAVFGSFIALLELYIRQMPSGLSESDEVSVAAFTPRRETAFDIMSSFRQDSLCGVTEDMDTVMVLTRYYTQRLPEDLITDLRRRADEHMCRDGTTSMLSNLFSLFGW